MAHTNQTPNYGLSEFVGTDKPAWLIDYNGDMEKIDLGLKDAKDVADAAKAEADQAALDIPTVTATANAANTKASASISNTSDTYDATLTYALGELVIYENLLYKNITAVTVPEPFDGSKWQRVTIESVLNDVKESIPTLIPINYNNPMQCDTVFLTSYEYIATKKSAIALTVRPMFNYGYSTGVQFLINGAVTLLEEFENAFGEISYVLNPGDRLTVQVKYSNYTINEVDHRGFIIEFP